MVKLYFDIAVRDSTILGVHRFFQPGSSWSLSGDWSVLRQTGKLAVMSKRVQFATYSRVIPSDLGGGKIEEADYQATAGVNYLLSQLLKGPANRAALSEDSLVARVGSVEGESYLSQILNPATDGSVLRNLATTQLNDDWYDLAETLRLLRPVNLAIASKASLQKPVTEAEAEFAVRFNSLANLLKAVCDELDKPYRRIQQEQVSSALVPPPEGSYEVESEIVEDLTKATVVARHVENADTAEIQEPDPEAIILGQSSRYELARLRVDDFVAGRTSEVDAGDICYVHTVESAQTLEEIAAKLTGKVSVAAAGPSSKTFLWFGVQTAFELDSYAVFSGGTASPR